MIDGKDMLESIRWMALSCTSFTGIAGCYVDGDGDFDGGFSINFFKLSASERTKRLKLTKEIPFVTMNVNLERYEHPQGARKPGSMRQPLMVMNECGLKNDALMDTFYDVVMEHHRAEREYIIPVPHNRCDIPAKGPDRERQRESEEVFKYMTCAVCLPNGEYEPDKSVCGFLFPAFTDRSGDLDHIDVFQAGAGKPHNEILKLLEII